MKIKAPAIIASALLVLHPLTASAQSKIVGGADAVDGDYPWMVALVKKNQPSAFDGQFCGGSLIDENWVLTAAHCVESMSAKDLEVWVGIHDLNDTAGAERRDIKGVYIHENYSTDGFGVLFNDVALLLLDSPVTTITPVAYASKSDDVVPGDAVRAIGWGDTKSTPQFPNILQQVDVTVQSISSANTSYGFNSLDFRHLAARDPGKDTCQGDSGGPLFDPDGAGGDPLLVGITSFGAGCAQEQPGIYANVGTYRSFIDGFVTSDKIDDPDASVNGKGQPIANGSTRAKRSNGTFLPGRTRSGKSKTATFFLRNSQTSLPLSVESVKSSSKYFTVKKEPSYVFGGDRAAISIRFRAPKRSKKIKSTITVETNDPLNPVYSFVVQAKSKYTIDLKKARRFRFPNRGSNRFPGNPGGGQFIGRN